jgi:hypothetical protein
MYWIVWRRRRRRRHEEMWGVLLLGSVRFRIISQTWLERVQCGFMTIHQGDVVASHLTCHAGDECRRVAQFISTADRMFRLTTNKCG